MTKKIYLVGLLGMLIIFGIVLFATKDSNMEEGPVKVSVINYSQENYTLIITKYNLNRTATIDETLLIEEPNNSFFDIKGFLTDSHCLLQKASFLNTTWVDGFNYTFIEEWEKYGNVSLTEDGIYKEIPRGNILQGYKFTNANFYLVDWNTKETISYCGTQEM